MGQTFPGYYPVGLTLTNPSYNPVTVTGTIKTSGKYGLLAESPTAWTVTNLGTISSAQISGGAGVQLGSGGTKVNGGTLINGATNVTGALIRGGDSGGVFVYSGPASLVENYGTIIGLGTAGPGVAMDGGGMVRNGASNDVTALINAPGNGVVVAYAVGTVVNYGTIASTGGQGIPSIYLGAGGSIINSGTAALIAGGAGVSRSGKPGAGDAGGLGIRVKGGGSITNTGTIAGGSGGASGYFDIGGYAGGAGGAGINLAGGGSVANAGMIVGGAGGAGGSGSQVGGAGGAGGIGVYLSNSGTITNTATIAGGQGGTGGSSGRGPGKGGTGGAGVSLMAGGSVINTGTIAGGQSGTGPGGNGATGAGIALATGGAVTNGSTGAATALISGGVGIQATGTPSATVTNYGTIAGTGGTAVQFGSGNDRLIDERGAVFTGNVDGGSGSNTLELASAATVGTVTGIGSQFLNFGSIAFDSGASWLISGNTTGLASGQIITGFTIGDTIDLTGFVAVSESVSSNALVLTNSVSNHVTLGIQGSFSTSSFLIPGDGSGGTDITIACFCRGTLILTPDGEAPVEELAIGDKVVTLSGEAKPIKWIGRRAYEGRFIAGKREALPICVTAGALADGMPAHDLWVSPAHALYIDGVLVPSEHLVNGATFLQAESVERVEYFHIELEAHDIIFAEGMPAETYVDCDNRLMFHNAGEFAALHPGYEGAKWAFCAPRLEAGSAELTAIREALFERAAVFGHPLDPDPDLHLIVDGATVRPESAGACRYRFAIPAGSRAVSIASRSQIPAAVDSRSSDRRRLGVPVERIALSDGEMSIEAWHGHSTLCEGFHEDEAGHRWTDGLACLPGTWLGSFPGGATLDLHLIPTEHRYRFPPPSRGTAAA